MTPSVKFIQRNELFPNEWYVYIDGSDTRIGYFGVYRADDSWYTDIHIKEYYRGRGYFKAIYDYYIEKLWDGRKLLARVLSENKRALRAHIKCGFKQIGKGNHIEVFLIKNQRRGGGTASRGRQKQDKLV